MNTYQQKNEDSDKILSYRNPSNSAETIRSISASNPSDKSSIDKKDDAYSALRSAIERELEDRLKALQDDILTNIENLFDTKIDEITNKIINNILNLYIKLGIRGAKGDKGAPGSDGQDCECCP